MVILNLLADLQQLSDPQHLADSGIILDSPLTLACRFIVDRRIFVVGFGLYGSIHGPSEYDVTIQVTILTM